MLFLLLSPLTSCLIHSRKKGRCNITICKKKKGLVNDYDTRLHVVNLHIFYASAMGHLLFFT